MLYVSQPHMRGSIYCQRHSNDLDFNLQMFVGLGSSGTHSFSLPSVSQIREYAQRKSTRQLGGLLLATRLAISQLLYNRKSGDRLIFMEFWNVVRQISKLQGCGKGRSDSQSAKKATRGPHILTSILYSVNQAKLPSVFLSLSLNIVFLLLLLSEGHLYSQSPESTTHFFVVGLWFQIRRSSLSSNSSSENFHRNSLL